LWRWGRCCCGNLCFSPWRKSRWGGGRTGWWAWSRGGAF
jgi:hypothetical protein